jgi:hypothetical protein
VTPARQTVTNLGDLLDEGDVVVDGGHSRWTDDQAHAAPQASGVRAYGIAACPAPGVRAVSDSPLLPCVAIPPWHSPHAGQSATAPHHGFNACAGCNGYLVGRSASMGPPSASHRSAPAVVHRDLVYRTPVRSANRAASMTAATCPKNQSRVPQTPKALAVDIRR